MANTFFSGTIHVDAAGETGTSAVSTGPVKVAYILFVPHANSDAVTITDGSGGATKIHLHGKLEVPQFLDFSAKPIYFKTSVYCSAITAGAHILLYTTSEGA